MLRVVLDTSVVIAALRSRSGASNGVIELVARGHLRPLVTTSLFLEYEAVLLRPEHRLVTRMTVADVDGFLAALASAAEPVDISFRWRPQLRDPKDELVLEAAVNGRAAAIVTHNVRDFGDTSRAFGVRVLLPGTLLREVQS